MVKFSPVQFFKKIGKKKLLIVSGVALLIMIIVGSGVYYLIVLKSQNELAALNKESQLAMDEFNQMNKVQLQALNGDLVGASSILIDDLKKAATDDAKISINNQLGYLYLNSNVLDKATEYANIALKIKDNAQSWNLLGHIAEKKLDWPSAVEAYQKAVDLTPGVSGDRDSSSDYLNSLNNAKAQK